jgi:hypothetical protein
MVMGRVKADAYLGNDGQPRSSLELTAQDVKFLQGGFGEQGADQGGGDYVMDEEDIPF